MNIDNDYDNDGNNIVPCPICLDVYCPSKEDGKCPEEDEFAKHYLNTPDTEGSVEELMRDLRHLASPYAETLSDMQRTSQFILLVNRLDKAMRTPDTEFDSDKEVVGSDCLCVLGSKKHNPECEYATPDTEMCICGEQECIGGAEVEIAGVCHRPNNPCYIRDTTTPDTEWESVLKEFDDLYPPVTIGYDGNETDFFRREKMREFIIQAISSRDTYWKENFKQMIQKSRQIKISDNKDITDGWDMALLNLQSAFDYTYELTLPTNEQPHYERRNDKSVWVTYENGAQKVEPYMHQDDMYSNMCASPKYCKCTE
jgi:hypothetical protein